MEEEDDDDNISIYFQRDFSNFLFPMSRGLACCINLQPGGPGDF